MTGKSMSTAPKLNYIDAMRLEINGELVCTMQAAAFAAWVEQAINRLEKPEVVRDKLASHDYTIFADRWHCLLTLIDYGFKVT
jgi:hypothetical protein